MALLAQIAAVLNEALLFQTMVIRSYTHEYTTGSDICYAGHLSYYAPLLIVTVPRLRGEV